MVLATTLADNMEKAMSTQFCPGKTLSVRMEIVRANGTVMASVEGHSEEQLRRIYAAMAVRYGWY